MKKIKIFGIGAVVLMILIAIMPIGITDWGINPDKIPHECDPPDNPSPIFLGTYYEDLGFGAYIRYWVTQEFKWVKQMQFTKQCNNDEDTPVTITITVKTWQEVTAEIEAQFPFTQGMFGGSVGMTMGFSSETSFGYEEIFHGDLNKIDIGAWYYKYTRLKVHWVFYDGFIYSDDGTDFSDWEQYPDVTWYECDFDCLIDSKQGDEIHNDVNGDCQDCGI